MTAAADFDAAIEKAFALSQKLDSAQSLVEELTAALAKSVAARTAGLPMICAQPAFWTPR